jgi:hypothetical protein
MIFVTFFAFFSPSPCHKRKWPGVRIKETLSGLYAIASANNIALGFARSELLTCHCMRVRIS